MQSATAQFAETQRIANLQLPRGIAERAWHAAIDMKLQAVVLARHAGQ